MVMFANYISIGISVSSTPVAVNNATADMAMFLMLGALRRIHAPYTAVRSSKWRGMLSFHLTSALYSHFSFPPIDFDSSSAFIPPPPHISPPLHSTNPLLGPTFELGHDPRHLTLGILGMGGIGREVANRAKAFGMKIQYHNRTRLSQTIESSLGATYVSFSDLMSASDVLSLNLSLNPSTTHIIGEKEFGMMKKGVVVINTARGKLIDEAALVRALEEGKVWSAGLDVYEEEPEIHAGLLDNPNVVLTPHIGTATVETQVRLSLPLHIFCPSALPFFPLCKLPNDKY